MKTSADFRRVYSFGKRFDGELMTVFALQNKLASHRLGLTASRKAIGNAVLRNRSKRVLRETFRLSDLQTLQNNYDWVINAKRKILRVKTQDAVVDFLRIITRVVCDEQSVSDGAGK